MTNFQNGAKKHENSVKNANHAESVGNILDNVENVPFALRGSQVKTILYFLFSFIAAAELTAALSFYTMSMGASVIIAAVFCGVLAFGFHALLHGILSDTAKGIVFSKRKESGAMSNEVTGNIILSIVLLAIASCTVFFVGKKGFTAYRATQYEKVQAEAKPKGDQAKGIDATMLTGKNGKIAAWKLEALTDLEKAKAKTTEATTAQATADRQAYDATTATITDIVGASAFLIELLLALLAYSIATAKLAAVMDEIARRNGASQPTSQQVQQAVTTNNQTAQSSPSVKKWNEYTTNHQDRIIEIFTERTVYAHFDKAVFRLALNDIDPTVNFGLYGEITFDPWTELSLTYDKLLRSKNERPTQQKQIGFSDNRATKIGNEGRIVIQGFARKNSEKTPITASVTDAVTANKIGTCKRCENEYEKTVYNKKFCCEDCKILYWQEKNGKLLRKGTATKV